MPATDPCAFQKRMVDNSISTVGELKQMLGEPDLPPKVRTRLEDMLKTQTRRLNANQRAFEACRRLHSKA